MLQYRYLSLIIIVTNLWLSESAKILDIASIMSKSHYSIHQKVLQGLASRGHEIVSISYFKSNTNLTNYQNILIPTDIDISYVDTMDITNTTLFNEFWRQLFFGRDVEQNFCSNILQNDYIQKLVKSESHEFDLLIAEYYLTQCYSLLAYKLNIPLVSLTPVSMAFAKDNILGNSFNPAYLPFIIGGYTTKMSFFQRLMNSMKYVIVYWFQFFMYDKNLKQLSKEVLNIEFPSENVLNKKLALAFNNNHHSFIARPLSPKMQEIGGVHIDEPQPLPKDILEFIETSKHGVIFFSFGTTIKASSIPVEKLKTIIDVFSTIPQKVLWRVNELNVTLPPNVKTSRWFPQRDILEHKNVIVFISHCGLFGTFEAIHTATPVLAIPILYDQFQNANILVEKEVAVRLDFDDLSKETLLSAIREIINNAKYKENMIQFSKVFKDRPMSPLDNAIYWIEYMIRHKGADNLHLPAAEMPLYQYLLIDVILFVVILIAVVIYIGKNIILLILSLLKNKVKDKIH